MALMAPEEPLSHHVLSWALAYFEANTSLLTKKPYLIPLHSVAYLFFFTVLIAGIVIYFYLSVSLPY